MPDATDIVAALLADLSSVSALNAYNKARYIDSDEALPQIAIEYAGGDNGAAFVTRPVVRFRVLTRRDAGSDAVRVQSALRSRYHDKWWYTLSGTLPGGTAFSLRIVHSEQVQLLTQTYSDNDESESELAFQFNFAS